MGPMGIVRSLFRTPGIDEKFEKGDARDWCIQAHIQAGMNDYIHKNAHTCVNTSIQTCMHVCMLWYMFLYIYMNMYIQTHKIRQTYMHKCVCTNIHVIHACMHASHI